MSYASVSYTGDGSTTNFTITFPYISQNDVVVTVDGSSASYTFLLESVIQFSSAPANGAIIQISRDTSDDSQAVVWQNAVTLTKEQLNSAFKQIFNLSQEAKAITERTIYQNYTGEFTAGDDKIVDLADPENDQDAATKGYVDGVFETYEPTILGHVSDAEDAKDAAETAQGLAEDARDAAVVAQGAAESAQTDAETAQTAAETAQGLAEDASALAERWAEEDEDVEVTTGKYSAKHWAAKAEDIASGNASSISFTPAGDLSSTDVQAALEELDTEKAPVSHTHNDLYYTESEVDSLLSAKAAVSHTHTVSALTNVSANFNLSSGTFGGYSPSSYVNTSQLPAAAFSAYLNYNGVSASVIEAKNISSVVRSGAGVYTITFSSAFSSVTYIVSAHAQYSVSSQYLITVNPASTTVCHLNVKTTSGSLADAAYIYLTFLDV